MSMSNTTNTTNTNETNSSAKSWSIGTLSYTMWGLVTLFFWLLFGEFAIAMRERSAIPSATELLRQYHASDTLTSMLIAVLPMAISMLAGPIISAKSDRYRSAKGRRIPFLLWQTPIGALAMIGLGFSPILGAALNTLLGSASPGLNVCVLLLFGLFWTVFECIAIMTLAIYAGLVNDVVPHALLGRFYAGFRIVSLGAGILFNKMIFAHTDVYLREIFVAIGILFGVGAMLMCLRVKEGQYPEPELAEVEDGHPHGFVALAKAYFVECFSHPYYLWIFFAIMFATLGPMPFNTFNQLYAGKLGITKAELGNMLGNSFIISLLLAYFIGMAVDKFSAVKVTMFTAGLGCITYVFGYFFIEGSKLSFTVVYMSHVVISGAFFTAAASLPMALFPKLRFMQFNSAAYLAIYGSNVIVGLILGPILDASGHNYKLTLLGGAFFDFIGVLFLIKVLKNYRALKDGIPPVFVKK